MTMRSENRFWVTTAALLAALCGAGAATAQTGSAISIHSPAPAPAPAANPHHESLTNEQLKALALTEGELRTRKQVIERDLNQVRLRYFRGVTNQKVRAKGWEKLQVSAQDPIALPILLDTFSGEDVAFRTQLIAMLAGMKSQPTDTALAWIAMTETDAALKGAAMDRIAQRTAEAGGEVPYGIQSVIAVGLEGEDNARAAAAANMALNLKLYQAIPAMIAAQVRNPNAGNPGTGAMGQIYIGTQRAFVSDLTPVVGDGAVAFDPQISTVTDGVVLRVFDAWVITYRTEVHTSLVGLARRGMPVSIAPNSLGYDQNAWMKWYQDEFLPARAAAEAAEKAATPVVATSAPAATEAPRVVPRVVPASSPAPAEKSVPGAGPAGAAPGPPRSEVPAAGQTKPPIVNI
ncbi:hypothetical protein BH11PLA1_BH11PLA1_11000 [soil metagenome]